MVHKSKPVYNLRTEVYQTPSKKQDFAPNLSVQLSLRILSGGINYSVNDLLSDVITYCGYKL